MAMSCSWQILFERAHLFWINRKEPSKTGNFGCSFMVFHRHVYNFSSVLWCYSTAANYLLRYDDAVVLRLSSGLHYGHQFNVDFSSIGFSLFVATFFTAYDAGWNFILRAAPDPSGCSLLSGNTTFCLRIIPVFVRFKGRLQIQLERVSHSKKRI